MDDINGRNRLEIAPWLNEMVFGEELCVLGEKWRRGKDLEHTSERERTSPAVTSFNLWTSMSRGSEGAGMESRDSTLDACVRAALDEETRKDPFEQEAGIAASLPPRRGAGLGRAQEDNNTYIKIVKCKMGLVFMN